MKVYRSHKPGCAVRTPLFLDLMRPGDAGRRRFEKLDFRTHAKHRLTVGFTAGSGQSCD